MNNKRGISLIVLVITIIVMIILASAIILALSGNGVIFKTNKAKFQNDMATMKEELSVYISNKEVETNGAYNHELFNADKSSLIEEGTTVEGKTILDIIKSMDKKYIDKIEIVNGRLRYTGNNIDEIKWSDEILEGIKGNNLEEAKIEQSNTIKLEDSVNTSLANYRIYGNSVQSGMPSNDTPVQVESVGDYVVDMNFDNKWIQGHVWGYEDLKTNRLTSKNLIKSESGIKYEITSNLPENIQFAVTNGTFTTYPYNSNDKVYDSGWKNDDLTFTSTVDGNILIAIRYKDDLNITPEELANYEINIKKYVVDEARGVQYKIPVMVKGKNLYSIYDIYSRNIDEEVTEDGRKCIKFTTALGGYFNGNFKENTQYTVSFYCKTVKYDTATTLTYDIPFRFLYTDGTYSRLVVANDGTWRKFTFTSDKGKTIKYIGNECIEWRMYNYIDVNTFQIEEGAQATDYEPYREEKINIYLDEPLRRIGNYADYIDFRAQEVVRNVEVVDATGTLPLEQSLSGLDTPVREKITIPSVILNDGKNTIDVLTKVQPSKIEAIYYKK